VKLDPTLLIPIVMHDMPVVVMEAMGDSQAYKYNPGYRCAVSCLPNTEWSYYL